MNKDDINITLVAWIYDSGQAKAVHELIALYRQCRGFELGGGSEKPWLGKLGRRLDTTRLGERTGEAPTMVGRSYTTSRLGPVIQLESNDI